MKNKQETRTNYHKSSTRSVFNIVWSQLFFYLRSLISSPNNNPSIDYLQNSNLFLCSFDISIEDLPSFLLSFENFFYLLKKTPTPKIFFFNHDENEFNLGLGFNPQIDESDVDLFFKKEMPFYLTHHFKSPCSKNNIKIPIINISSKKITLQLIAQKKESCRQIMEDLLSTLSRDINTDDHFQTSLIGFNLQKSKPNQIDFTKIIEKFKDENSLKKVVLARKKTYTPTQEDITARHLLNVFLDNYLKEKQMEDHHPDSYLFIFQKDDEDIFISTTPELFLRKNKNFLQMHSLAGTRKRSLDHHEDLERARELMNSTKDNDEQDIVTKGIIETITPYLVQKIDSPEKVILKLETLMHIKTLIQGKLKEGVHSSKVFKLIDDLHPTAAVGGHPKQLALSFLEENEAFSRGHYASPMGIIQGQDIHIVVGIRSVAIKKNKLHFFAGAGIIKSSNPVKEWKEIENKFAHMERYFNL